MDTNNPAIRIHGIVSTCINMLLCLLLIFASHVTHCIGAGIPVADPGDVISAPVIVTLETGNPLHVLKPGEENLLGIRLNNHGEKEASINLRYTITFAGAPPSPPPVSKDFSIGGKSDVFIPLPAPLRYGVYKLNIKTTRHPQSEVREQNPSYCYMPPAGPVPGRAKGFLFGINEHPQWYSRDHQKLMAQAAAWAGVKVLREGIDWRRMQPTPDKWDFDSFDFVLNEFGKHDIELASTYPGPFPKWAIAADWKPANPKAHWGRPRPDYGHWKTFIKTFIERYKGRIRFVETWNEPDLIGFANFTPGEYVRLMEIAYRETKKIAPETTVQSGGFTQSKLAPGITSDPDFLEKTIRTGKDYYDILAFHGHGSFQRYEYHIQNLAAMRASLGDDKPWWPNETAISSIHVGETGQAETLFRKLLYSWANGAIGYNWYNLRNKGFDPNNNEHNFGLVTRDFYPKPAYVTYNMLARYYREGKFVRAHDLGPGLYAYLFRGKSGDHLLANWNTDTNTDIRPIIITQITGKASIVDLWGNETPINVINGALVLPTCQRPSTLRIIQQENVPIVGGELFQISETQTAHADKNRHFLLTIKNPAEQDLDLDFQLANSQGTNLPLALDKNAINLRPGETRDILFTAPLETFSSATGNTPPSLSLGVRVGDLYQGKVKYKIRQIMSIPQGDFSDTPTFVLDNANQITSLVVNEPSNAHLFWKGPDDLGAKIWLCEKNDALHFKVIVTDDIHTWPVTGTDTWLKDKLRLNIIIPGNSPMWDISFAHLESAPTSVHIEIAPVGHSPDKALRKISAKTRRDESARETIYEVEIPFDGIGLTRNLIRQGLGFSLQITDNDGLKQESVISIAPDLGFGKTTDNWPIVIFDR
ncbi:MAG: hypothetical protein LBK99_07735 [Opitutaceae bacterium]|jgi:hypothetical protein|nr:hypothetical protein [Opitutaceae bacterium]